MCQDKKKDTIETRKLGFATYLFEKLYLSEVIIKKKEINKGRNYESFTTRELKKRLQGVHLLLSPPILKINKQTDRTKTSKFNPR